MEIPDQSTAAAHAAELPLAGSVALVTAAAGAGIGQTTVRRLAAAGADVVVTDQHAERTARVAESIATETGRRALGLPLDVTDEDGVAAVVDRVLGDWGRIDILVNNSGYNEVGPVWELPTPGWRRVIDVCLTGHFFTIRAVLPSMIASRTGAIVNLASIAGWTGSELGEAAYNAAKAGVMGLTRAVAIEAAPHGVRVNAIAPGLTPNPFLSRSMPKDYLDAVAGRVPLGRPTKPDDIADAVLFLVSDRSASITGEILNVSGGLYLHA